MAAPATGHKDLTSKEQFKAALETKDRYVLIFAYQGEVPPGAEEAAKRHANNTDAYKVDIDQFPSAKENLKLEKFPAIVIFKNGEEIKRVEEMNKDKVEEVAAVLV